MARKLSVVIALFFALTVSTASPASAASSNLVAPPSVCPQIKLDGPAVAQEEAMLCMTNFARSQVGETPLESTAALQQSAAEKSRDILRCDSFSHYACGREFTYWIRESGYLSTECWRAGENLAWGTGGYGTVRAIFRAWLRSPAHRANVLGDFSQIGIDLQTGSLSGHTGVHVWTQHFGSHCEGPSAQG